MLAAPAKRVHRCLKKQAAPAPNEPRSRSPRQSEKERGGERGRSAPRGPGKPSCAAINGCLFFGRAGPAAANLCAQRGVQPKSTSRHLPVLACARISARRAAPQAPEPGTVELSLARCADPCSAFTLRRGERRDLDTTLTAALAYRLAGRDWSVSRRARRRRRTHAIVAS